MYGDEIFVGFIVTVFVGLMVFLCIWAVNASEADERHEKDMRNQYSQCVKAGKEWVLTKEYGIDGICVTKR